MTVPLVICPLIVALSMPHAVMTVLPKDASVSLA
jgi:hypothetical protein